MRSLCRALLAPLLLAATSAKIIQITESLAEVAVQAEPGDTLVFAARKGSWRPQRAEGLRGTAEQPIVITRADASSTTLSGLGVSGSTSRGRPYDALLSLRNCSHVTVRGLELSDALACNGSNLAIDPLTDWFGADRGLCGSGLAVWDGEHVTIENVSVHRVWNYGWAATGSHLTVRDSLFTDLQLCNENGTGDCQRALHGGLPHPGTGWGQGLATGIGIGCAAAGGDQSNCKLSSHVTFEGNTIQRSWGESIDPLYAEYVTATNNRIENVYSVAIYMDNSRHCIIDSNALKMDQPAFYRNFGGYKAAASGFSVGTEHWCESRCARRLCMGVRTPLSKLRRACS
jgi:hypothetical protein